MHSLTALAKLNLTLDVLGIRPDGYHELESVFGSVTVADRLRLVPDGPRGHLGLVVRGLPAPPGPANLCLEAARRLAEGRPGLPGVTLVLEKRIPLASGLGGGSADAAAVLEGLNRFWRLGLSRAELLAVAAGVGSDVPFCLEGGLALVGGRGDRVRPIPFPAHPLWLVLLRPPGTKTTAGVYAAYDRLPPGTVRPHRPETGRALRALAAGDWETLATALGNVLEPALAEPRVSVARGLLERAGALATAMTGSGPTVFGIARDRDHAREVAARAAAGLPCRSWWLYLARLAPGRKESIVPPGNTDQAT